MTPQRTIDVRIEALQKGLDEVRTDVRELRADNKTLRDTIDDLRDKMEERFRASDAKITALSDAIASMRGLQIAMLRVVAAQVRSQPS
ncbi:MAG TPA: hypothetical protein VFS52_12795 [Steroidobacteraceae bacterium]|nr:hypothetical protein [Steroidobacteraceae bacterium]